jgi:TP901 family phage tail tape measure protein
VTDYLPPVVARLIADVGEFNAAMGEAGAKLEGFQAAQAKLAGAGKVAMLAMGAAAAGVAYESVKLASNFNQAMELIHTQAGASQAEVEGLKNSVLALAPATGIGPEKLAEGLYHIESTGFRGQQALDILKAAAQDAAMGLADLDTVTYALSGTMSVGMKDIHGAADATAYLNTIVGMGDMKMDKLAAAIGTGVLPSFKSAGLGMVDFGAALATISDNSVGADEAATRLRMTVSLMAAPSGKAKDALASIGIGATQLADDMRKPDGLLAAVMDLKTHLEESGKTASQQNAIISQAFGGGRSSSAILTLLEESDRLKSKYAGLGTAASRAAQQQDAWAQQQKQFSQQMKELGAEVQVIGVKIGEFLIPYIQKSAEWLTKHIEVVKIAALVIGGVLVAAMMAFTYSVIANTVAMLANPITWIVLGIVAAVALLVVGIYELVKHWGTIWKWIKDISLDVWHALVTAWNAAWRAVAGVVLWIWSNIIKPIVDFFWNDLIKPLIAYFTMWWHVVEFVFDIVSAIAKVWMTAFSIAFHAVADVILWWWHHVTEPVFNLLWKWAIVPTVALIQWLGRIWMDVWNSTAHQLSVAWTIIKQIFGWLNTNAIQPTWTLIKEFGAGWAKVWEGIGNALMWVYNRTIKPTIDLIMRAIHAVESAWNSIQSGPASAAKSVTGFFGFSDGGPVPGMPGQPMLAVVHGGEYVLSRDMIARGRVGVGGPGDGSSIGSGTPRQGGGPSTLVAHLYIDGTRFHTAYIPVAQKYKERNGQTGLS